MTAALWTTIFSNLISDFKIPLYVQHNIVELRRSNNLSSKYQILCCKDKEIRKFEFVAKTQFLSVTRLLFADEKSFLFMSICVLTYIFSLSLKTSFLIELSNLFFIFDVHVLKRKDNNALQIKYLRLKCKFFLIPQ